MRGFPVELLTFWALVYFVLAFTHKRWEEMFDGLFLDRVDGYVTVGAPGEEGFSEVEREVCTYAA